MECGAGSGHVETCGDGSGRVKTCGTGSGRVETCGEERAEEGADKAKVHVTDMFTERSNRKR